MDSQPLYRKLAAHYLGAIKAGEITHGARMPSVRSLMRLHDVSLSTALQTCRQLEKDGWIEARPRSGYFVRLPRRVNLMPIEEPDTLLPPGAAQYVSIHGRASQYLTGSHASAVKINLSASWAAPELYPAEQLRNAAIRAMRRHPDRLARATPPGGNMAFRAALAKRLMNDGMVLSPEEILVTHGCTEALNLALRAVAVAGDVVAVESPASHTLFRILENLGLRAVEIPVSATGGLAVEALQTALRFCEGIKAVVVAPHLQDPLSSIMPDANKRRLVQCCEENGIALIEVDALGDLVEEGPPLHAAKAWDRSGNVIYCGSMRRAVAPGLPLGWMAAGRWQARAAMLKQSLAKDNEEWSQIAMSEYLSSGGLDRHLRHLRAALHSQRERMADTIAGGFPAGTRLNVPEGGMTLWVELPDKLPAKRVFDAALREGILLSPGALFSNTRRFDHCIRVSCGHPYTEEVDAAVQRLGQLVNHLLHVPADAA